MSGATKTHPRAKAREILRAGKPLYRGSLIQYRRRCGARGCKCSRGELHEGWALSFSSSGKTQVVYIADKQKRQIAEGLKRYARLQQLLEQIITSDVAALRERSRRYKQRT